MKNRHYEKLAQREKAPILFNTASLMCQGFSQGLQQCAYNQDKWPTVWYETQNQHCTALLNIVATQLESLAPMEPELMSPQTTTPLVSTTSPVTTSGLPIDHWFEFGLGYGFGLFGSLLVMLLRWLCRRLYHYRQSRSQGSTAQLPARAPFAFMRGTPTRLPAVQSIPDVRADIAISYTETVNPVVIQAEV